MREWRIRCTFAVVEQLGKHGRRVKELRRRIRSRQAGEVVVDGCRLVDDLVRWDLAVRELYLDPELAVCERSRPWISASQWCATVDGAVLRELAPTRSPQGVLAVVEEPTWPPWSGASGFAVFLECVQDPGNVGAIIRSAAGLGASAVLLSPGCADPFHPASVRGSAGAVFRLCVEREVTAKRAVDRVREARGGVWAAAAGGLPVHSWQPTTPLLLMLGAEGAGLDERTTAMADGVVTIPLARDVESLNVAVAAGVLLERLRSAG